MRTLPSTPSSSRLSRFALRPWAIGGAVVAAFVLATALLDHLSVHFVAANSDGATELLQGFAVAHGHLLLHGWLLPLDSFLTTEVPFYAVAVAIAGLHAGLVNLVPAAIAALVVLVAATLAGRGASPAARWAGAAVVAGVLLLPTPALAFFELQGPWHLGTELCCLLAFWAAATGRWSIVPLAVLALAAAVFGDLQAVALGVVPVALAAVAAGLRRREVGAAWPGLVVAAGGPVVAVLARQLADALGAFGLVDTNPTATTSVMAHNVARIPTRLAGLFGFRTVPIGPTTTASHLSALHLVTFVLVIATVAWAVWRLLAGVVGGRRVGGGFLEDVLLFGLAGDLVTFVALSGTGNGDYARYLTAGAVDATILLGRACAERAADGRLPVRRAAWAVAGFVLVVGVVGLPLDLGRPAVARPASALAAFLESHHLTEGLGDYWSASIVTTTSGGQVAVRPVITAPDGRLERYGRESAADWYAGQRFRFLVFDTRRPWRGVGLATAEATFGRPARVLSSGTYRVVVFAHAATVSPLGYSRA